jgi:hypothetical protein
MLAGALVGVLDGVLLTVVVGALDGASAALSTVLAVLGTVCDGPVFGVLSGIPLVASLIGVLPVVPDKPPPVGTDGVAGVTAVASVMLGEPLIAALPTVVSV